MNNTIKNIIIGLIAQVVILIIISTFDNGICLDLLLQLIRKPSYEAYAKGGFLDYDQQMEFYTTMVQKGPSKPGWSVIEISNKYNELPTGNYSKHEVNLKKINGKTFIIHDDDKCKYCKEKEE